MEKSEQILLRRLLKKNGFIKSDTSDNKDLMEFTYGHFLAQDYIIIYTYDEVEIHYADFNEAKINNINEFIELFTKLTGKEIKK